MQLGGRSSVNDWIDAKGAAMSVDIFAIVSVCVVQVCAVSSGWIVVVNNRPLLASFFLKLHQGGAVAASTVWS